MVQDRALPIFALVPNRLFVFLIVMLDRIRIVENHLAEYSQFLFGTAPPAIQNVVDSHKLTRTEAINLARN